MRGEGEKWARDGFGREWKSGRKADVAGENSFTAPRSPSVFQQRIVLTLHDMLLVTVIEHGIAAAFSGIGTNRIVQPELSRDSLRWRLQRWARSQECPRCEIGLGVESVAETPIRTARGSPAARTAAAMSCRGYHALTRPEKS